MISTLAEVQARCKGGTNPETIVHCFIVSMCFREGSCSVTTAMASTAMRVGRGQTGGTRSSSHVGHAEPQRDPRDAAAGQRRGHAPQDCAGRVARAVRPEVERGDIGGSDAQAGSRCRHTMIRITSTLQQRGCTFARARPRCVPLDTTQFCVFAVSKFATSSNDRSEWRCG